MAFLALALFGCVAVAVVQPIVTSTGPVGTRSMLSRLRAGLLIVAAVLTVAAMAAACGGDGEKSDAPGTTATTTVPARGTTPNVAVPAGAPKIDQQNLSFKPDKITAKVGETVYFPNNDSAVHTVVVNGKNVSGNMKPGDVYSWKAETAGEYKITCEYHPQMKATVTVQ